MTNDLISRDALLEAVKSAANPGDIEWMIARAPLVIPQVVANISGGILQGASGDYRVDVYALDFDLDVLRSDSTGVVIEGSQAFRGQCSVLIDPKFVAEVVDAEEIYLLSGKPVEEED